MAGDGWGGLYVHCRPSRCLAHHVMSTTHPCYLAHLSPDTQRSKQKTRLDYNGVAAKVKDYLRATLVVTTMPEVCRVWGAVEELKAQGRLEVVSIKNRLRGGATSTGYRDINMSVKFRGHVCEIQIQLAAILEVKQHQVRHANID